MSLNEFVCARKLGLPTEYAVILILALNTRRRPRMNLEIATFANYSGICVNNYNMITKYNVRTM